MKIKISVLISFLLFFWVNIDAQTFKAGAAFRVITPENLIPISGGMGTPILPTGKKGDLFVRAFVLEKGKTIIAIVSVDNLGWPAYLGDRSRKLIKGIPPENVLIGATHAHSAPDAYGFTDEQGNTAADRKLISPDLCGPLYDRIESKVGGMAIFMNSAQGGMVTADTR
ncbi:MAG: hypothetical protein WC865_16615, partial [Bacteroidales bacterium]